MPASERMALAALTALSLLGSASGLDATLPPVPAAFAPFRDQPACSKLRSMGDAAERWVGRLGAVPGRAPVRG